MHCGNHLHPLYNGTRQNKHTRVNLQDVVINRVLRIEIINIAYMFFLLNLFYKNLIEDFNALPPA